MRPDLLSFIRQALPPSYRTPLKIALTRMLFTPIMTAWKALDTLQESLVPRATASGQTAVLRSLLNQALGFTHEIYIVDGNFRTVDFQVVIPIGVTADQIAVASEILSKYHLTTKRYSISTSVGWAVPVEIKETHIPPDWLYGLGLSHDADRNTSIYFHVKDDIKWWIERPSDPQPTGGDGWTAKTWALATTDGFTDPWNYVARLNPTVLGVNGILPNVSYTLKVCRRANEAEIYVREAVIFANVTAGITPEDLRFLLSTGVTETNVKPPQLTALAYSRLELTHEHSFYVNATERPYYKVVKVGDVTLPNGGSGWKPNFFYTAKSNTFNPPYGWVIRFNPAVLGVNGILAGTTYQLALWFNSNPGVVFVRNFTPVGDAGITPINLTPVIPDPDPEEPDEPTDPGGGEEAGSGDGPGMGGVVETTIIASNRNVMNLAVSWVTVSGVQRAKITDNSTYSTPGGQHRGIHLDGGEWLIDDTSWQNEPYPPRTRVSIICVVSPNPRDSYTTITAEAQAHVSIGDAP
jgi:hypothetical protein